MKNRRDSIKSLIVYELPENFVADFENKDFDEWKFKECGTLVQNTIGLIHNTFDSYVEHLSGGVQLLTIQTQKKSPKKSHVDSIAEKKINTFRENTGNPPSRNELNNIKDDAFMEVLGKTFPDAPKDFKVLFVNNLLFMEVGSYTKGEELFSLLENVLEENLPYSHPEIDNAYGKFQSFIENGIDDPYVLGSSTKLIDIEGRTTSISKGSLDGSAASDLVKDGAEVELLELEFDSIITFKVKPTLEFTSIKYSSEMVQSDDEGTVLLQVREIVRMFKDFKDMMVRNNVN